MASALLNYDPALIAAMASSPQDVITPLPVIASALDSLIDKTSHGDLLLFRSQARAYAMASVESGHSAVSSMPIQTIGQPPAGCILAGKSAQVCIKTGYVADDDVFVSKVAGGGGAFFASETDEQNGKLTPTGNTGIVLVFSQKTMRLTRLLLDEGLLTEIRTAAASVLASKLLHPIPASATDSSADVDCIGIIGGGIQAIWQLRFLRSITSCRRVVIKTRTDASATAFIEKMAGSDCEIDREWSIHIATPETSFRSCQLIHTLTYAREPVLTLDDVSSSVPLHITAVGSDSVGKKELAVELLGTADLRVFDNLEQSKARGELQGTDFGAMEQDRELGGLIREAVGASGSGSMSDSALDVLLEPRGQLRKFVGNRRGRPVVFSVFDTSGMAVQDIQIAKLVTQTLEEIKSGQQRA